MNRLQIALSREIRGWPLYSIVIAMGQVCVLEHGPQILSNLVFLDVECYELPDDSSNRSKLAKQYSAVHHRKRVSSLIRRMVSTLSYQASAIRSFFTLVVLRCCVFLDWATFRQQRPNIDAYHHVRHCNLVLCCCFCGRIFVLFHELWGGSGM